MVSSARRPQNSPTALEGSVPDAISRQLNMNIETQAMTVHPQAMTVHPHAKPARLDPEEQIARLSLLQWESRGPWALGWILQHFPSALAFWREGRQASMALAGWCQTQQSKRGKPLSQEAIALQIDALTPHHWRASPFLLSWLQSSNHHVLWSLQDDRYPESLQQGSGACRALFVEGDPVHLRRHGLAIVGGRACSDRAAELARSFAETLAGAGLSIISGMAEGIDAAAHLGALQAKGVTIAVMGTGVDRCYPRVHQHLREKIAEQGAVITALLPGQRIEKFRFLQRNRLIAGLAVAVLVVQARLQSGALSTAQAAADLGKNVFAVPGSIDDPRSKGCHQLIRQGASLTERMEDIYSELPWLLAAPRKAIVSPQVFSPEKQVDGANRSGTPQIDLLRQRIGHDAFDVHHLAHLMQSSYETALLQSLRWELEGLIHREPNGRYVLRML